MKTSALEIKGEAMMQSCFNMSGKEKEKKVAGDIFGQVSPEDLELIRF